MVLSLLLKHKIWSERGRPSLKHVRTASWSSTTLKTSVKTSTSWCPHTLRARPGTLSAWEGVLGLWVLRSRGVYPNAFRVFISSGRDGRFLSTAGIAFVVCDFRNQLLNVLLPVMQKWRYRCFCVDVVLCLLYLPCLSALHYVCK